MDTSTSFHEFSFHELMNNAKDPNELCRLCLQKGPFINIFENDPEGLLVPDIERYYQIKIIDCENKSKMLCMKCMDKLQIWRDSTREFALNQHVQLYNFIKNESLIKTELHVFVPQLKSMKNFQIQGCIKCKFCFIHFDTLKNYIKHLEKKHEYTVLRKEPNIKLCPICDHNYSTNEYNHHVNLCTKSMNVSGTEFGCAYCKSIFVNTTDSQFRNHFLYCKSFQEILWNNSVKYYLCIHCTFISDNKEMSINHAVSKCIHFQLKMQFAYDTNEKAQLTYKTCSKLPEQVLFSNYRFFCYYCGKGFFSEYIFTEHLKLNNGERCRQNSMKYCRHCQSDFNSELEYNNHFEEKVMPKAMPIPQTSNELMSIDQSIPVKLEIVEMDEDGVLKNEYMPCELELNIMKTEMPFQETEVNEYEFSSSNFGLYFNISNQIPTNMSNETIYYDDDNEYELGGLNFGLNLNISNQGNRIQENGVVTALDDVSEIEPDVLNILDDIDST